MEAMTDYCGWHGTIGEFVGQDAMQWSQVSRGRDSLGQLKAGLQEAVTQIPAAIAWPMVLEFGRPDDGRPPPDVVILAGQYLLVLVFKATEHPVQAHLDLVVAHARNLRRYHSASRDLTAIPVLVPARTGLRAVLRDGVSVVSPDKLFGLFKMFGLETARPAVDLRSWLAADHAAPQARSQLEAELASWFDHLAAGDDAVARDMALHIRDQGFDFYLTRDEEAAHEYLSARYDGHARARDLPIVAWTDGLDQGGEEYRALIAGGRDGAIVLVPPQLSHDVTFRTLAEAGVTVLPRGALILA